jgi:hypothetical protein
MKKYFTQTLFFNSNNKRIGLAHNEVYNYIAVRVFEIIDEKFIYIYNARKKFLHNGFEFKDEEIEKYCNKIDEYYCESTTVLINDFKLHFSFSNEAEMLKYLGDKGVDRILNITNLDFWAKSYIDYLRCRNYNITEIHGNPGGWSVNKYDYYVIYKTIDSSKINFPDLTENIYPDHYIQYIPRKASDLIWKKIPVPRVSDDTTPGNNIKSCIKESGNYNRNILGNCSHIDYDAQYKYFQHKDFVSQEELFLCNCCGSEISKETRICRWCSYSILLNNIREEDISLKFPDINTKKPHSVNNSQPSMSSSGCLGMILILIIFASIIIL